jgi:hypothetical protein
VLQKISNTMCATYAKRSGMKAADVQKMMDSTTWLNAQECVDEGFADEICQPGDDDSAQGRAIFDLSHFKNVPKGMIQDVTSADDKIDLPDFYRERLKLYERTLKH